MKRCIIKIGNSQALSRVLIEELKRRGYREPEDNPSGLYLYLTEDGWTKRLYAKGQLVTKGPPVEFDASTQFGALLEFLDAPEKPALPFNGELTPDGVLLRPIGWILFLSDAEVEQLCAAVQARKEAE